MVREHARMKLPPIPIVRTFETRAATGTTRALERAERSGRLSRVRHGAYARPEDLASASSEARHLVLVEATRSAARGEPVFSHESAAALHRIPLLGELPTRARITVPIGGGKSNASVQRTQRRLGEEDVVVLPDGTRATSPILTAIDLSADRSVLSASSRWGICGMSWASRWRRSRSGSPRSDDSPGHGRRRLHLRARRSDPNLRSSRSSWHAARISGSPCRSSSSSSGVWTDASTGWTSLGIVVACSPRRTSRQVLRRRVVARGRPLAGEGARGRDQADVRGIRPDRLG